MTEGPETVRTRESAMILYHLEMTEKLHPIRLPKQDLNMTIPRDMLMGKGKSLAVGALLDKTLQATKEKGISLSQR